MLLNMEMAETKEVSLTSGLLQAVVLGVLLSDRHPSHLPACLPPALAAVLGRRTHARTLLCDNCPVEKNPSG